MAMNRKKHTYQHNHQQQLHQQHQEEDHIYGVNRHLLNSIVFRPFTQSDTFDLQQLQGHLFPVKYRSSFYRKLLQKDFISVLAFKEGAEVTPITSPATTTLTSTLISKATTATQSEAGEQTFDASNNEVLLASPTTSTTSTSSSVSTTVDGSGGIKSPTNVATLLPQQRGNELVGVATARISKDSGLCSLFFSNINGYILTFGVKEQYRGLGIGARLIDHICDILEKQRCKLASLHVKVDNKEAIQFYQRNGFTIDEHLVDYYLIQDIKYDALKMTRMLRHDARNSWISWFSSLAINDNNVDNNNNNSNNNNNTESINIGSPSSLSPPSISSLSSPTAQSPLSTSITIHSRQGSNNNQLTPLLMIPDDDTSSDFALSPGTGTRLQH
ncbi:hypothetical protein SAMD00019534_055000 [Acytostelium subglobosum LB1]|uniref:hypothetical protein n=1 Tax=Acytostelium subglobosum LB1 TaxID=1410327 RepID=UPI0006450A8C|nr:hypothetical protein SAMD00019534_055000 [Acytostelium subglobosum LB1]GAM22325.1 hypothetical protein SAMD00019534_055000 [Acytostelium subglobosum LB1]|eukprot:XP_012754445.1 hypothetical protein SAMD00019534_055000 [Acytostelium subglobosum LB1]